MSAAPSDFTGSGYTTHIPEKSNMRWVVCGLLFLATTINYMDRSVFSLIEPALHHLPFLGWNFNADYAHQDVFNDHFSTILACFQVAYGIGFLIAGRLVDKLGRICLGLGESGNFPAAIKAVTEWFPNDERALATGIFNSGTNAASLVAPWLIPIVTIKYGWHAAFLTTGSMGMLWLVLWLLFPYNKLRRGATETQARLAPVIKPTGSLYGQVLRQRGTWAFAIAKGLTDPIWWFYLFFLPKYFHETYNLDLKHLGLPIIIIYTFSSVGSILGGNLSGMRMRRGHSVNSGRKFAMLTCALLALPVVGVPYMHTLFGLNWWPAVGLLSLAAAAHQGWSANLFSTPTDMFPSTAVSTIVGIGGAAGAGAGALFTKFTGWVWSSHPFMIFFLASLSYVLALLIFQLMVPRLGAPSEPDMPITTP